MNPQAKILNDVIESQSPALYSLLSKRGKSLFFPAKGIMSQAKEAKEAADSNLNATIGIAQDADGPLGFSSLRRFISDELSGAEIFNYSSSYGNQKLRELWRQRIIELTPSLKDKVFSMPLVTAGLTHGLYITCQLFLDAGETIVLPDKIWGNYRLMIQTNHKANIVSFPFFKNQHFHQQAFETCIHEQAEKTGQVRLILNFPNNPTGYSPSPQEAKNIIKSLLKVAEQGARLLVILDEAYFGLFFKQDIYKYSLFSELADLHENITAVKLCGSTKEFFAWGFRIGFITFANKLASKSSPNSPKLFYDALEKKAAGNLRASVSNCSTLSQSMLTRLLSESSYKEDFKKNYDILEVRLKEVQRVLQNKDYEKFFIAYPYNSGYFMLVKLQGELALKAETVRTMLLEKHKVGVIATSESDIRIAFSCIEKQHIAKVFQALYSVCQDLSS